MSDEHEGHLHRTSYVYKFQKSSRRNKQAVLHTRPFSRIGTVYFILDSEYYDRRAKTREALHNHNSTNNVSLLILFSDY
jgi:hypothetical protein